jgi:hypothetical protein
LGALPIETVKLGANLTMLSGPGGNVVILFVLTAKLQWTVSLSLHGKGSSRSSTGRIMRR